MTTSYYYNTPQFWIFQGKWMPGLPHSFSHYIPTICATSSEVPLIFQSCFDPQEADEDMEWQNSLWALMRNDMRIFSAFRPSCVLGNGCVSSKLKQLSQKHNKSNLTYYFNPVTSVIQTIKLSQLRWNLIDVMAVKP